MGEAAEPRVDNREQAFDVTLNRDVSLNRHPAPPGLLDIGHDRVGRPLVVQIVHRHIVAFNCSKPGGRRPDATAGAGDEHDLGGRRHFKSHLDGRADAAPSRC
jgi:hypothetical protein